MVDMGAQMGTWDTFADKALLGIRMDTLRTSLVVDHDIEAQVQRRPRKQCWYYQQYCYPLHCTEFLGVILESDSSYFLPPIMHPNRLFVKLQ
jgi:hypothetical protein